MNFIKQSILITFLISFMTLTGCVTKRVTTSNGAVVEEKYVVKRPIKKFVQTVEFE